MKRDLSTTRHLYFCAVLTIDWKESGNTCVFNVRITFTSLWFSPFTLSICTQQGRGA